MFFGDWLFRRLLASDGNPLDLIERDHIGGAVVELGRARALVRRHGLSILKRTPTADALPSLNDSVLYHEFGVC